jgi:hypothetical protein
MEQCFGDAFRERLLFEAQLGFISAHPARGATGQDKRCDLLHSHRLHRLHEIREIRD